MCIFIILIRDTVFFQFSSSHVDRSLELSFHPDKKNQEDANDRCRPPHQGKKKKKLRGEGGRGH